MLNSHQRNGFSVSGKLTAFLNLVNFTFYFGRVAVKFRKYCLQNFAQQNWQRNWVSSEVASRIFLFSWRKVFPKIWRDYICGCNVCNAHCVKSVRIRSYSGPYFPAFERNTERYGVCLHIQLECGKIRTRRTPNTGTFHAVVSL